jgi:hypothetical protein
MVPGMDRTSRSIISGQTVRSEQDMHEATSRVGSRVEYQGFPRASGWIIKGRGFGFRHVRRGRAPATRSGKDPVCHALDMFRRTS